MKRSTLSVAIYLFLIFLSGALVGGFGYRLYMARTVVATSGPTHRSPEEYRRRYLNEMQTRLNLNGDQLQQLDTILDETRARYRDLFDRYRPEMKVIESQQINEINAILDETQRAEYATMRKEREHRRSKKGSSGKIKPPGC
jgi:hypothetical protein